jgi:hypothetical protein
MVLMAPEWRLSLHLKRHELAAKRAALGSGNNQRAAELDKTLAELQALAALDVVDIVDESDEVLSHKWVGGPDGAVAEGGMLPWG